MEYIPSFKQDKLRDFYDSIRDFGVERISLTLKLSLTTQVDTTSVADLEQENKMNNNYHSMKLDSVVRKYIWDYDENNISSYNDFFSIL